ncbi:MAG: Signal transduction histidine kinaselike protein [Actinomycetia bacterium]|nr:Signal transduction histidine kinaselike protein [Actinomycetes bacterium]
MAQGRATAGWDRVLPLIKVGRLPAVLPDRKDGKVQAIQVLDARNRVVAATRQLVGKPPIATLRSTHGGSVRTQRTLCRPAGLKGCMTVISYKVYSQPGGIWLLNVAVPTVPWYGNSTALFLAIGASVLMTAMVAAGTFRGVGKDLASVNAIRRELAEITATGLDRRVPVPKTEDEIKLLAETENATLDRLECAYQQLQQFTSDASHDLRCPITAMRAHLEEGLMYPDDTDWPRTATAVLAATERLQAIVTDLLTLARLDGSPVCMEATDLAELVGVELDRRPCRVEVIRKLQEGVFTQCDRLRICRLVGNLIDNANRHADTQMTIIVSDEGSMAVLEVADDGAGIAGELREVVFERFTRLEDSRDRDPGGTGLGLAIARQIAEAHHGTLTIEDSLRGARFVLRLPRCDAPLSYQDPAQEGQEAGHERPIGHATGTEAKKRLLNDEGPGRENAL